MSELKMGDRVRILNGGECKVLAKLGGRWARHSLQGFL